MQNLSDHNLLFGTLALQMNFISREGLIAGVTAWIQNKQMALEEILLGQQAISRRQKEVLSELLQVHLEQHAGDVQQSLASLPAAAIIQESLHSLGDKDIADSLESLSTKMHYSRLSHQVAETLSISELTAVGDRYRFLRQHARGGLGQVSVALDEELQREVALKEMRADRNASDDSVARFVTEAKVTGALEHPGIVPVYGLGRYANDRPFYAMRFIRGESLKTAVGGLHSPEKNVTQVQPLAEHSLELRRLLSAFVDVCNAVEYAHSRGVLHRDLKPDNVMLGKFGETLVVDWGLAKIIGLKDAQADEQVLDGNRI